MNSTQTQNTNSNNISNNNINSISLPNTQILTNYNDKKSILLIIIFYKI